MKHDDGLFVQLSFLGLSDDMDIELRSTQPTTGLGLDQQTGMVNLAETQQVI